MIYLSFNIQLHSEVFSTEVTYCGTDSEGFVLRFDFSICIISYSPLIESLRQGIPPGLRALRPNWISNGEEVECFEDHSQVAKKLVCKSVHWMLSFVSDQEDRSESSPDSYSVFCEGPAKSLHTGTFPH